MSKLKAQLAPWAINVRRRDYILRFTIGYTNELKADDTNGFIPSHDFLMHWAIVIILFRLLSFFSLAFFFSVFLQIFRKNNYDMLSLFPQCFFYYYFCILFWCYLPCMLIEVLLNWRNHWFLLRVKQTTTKNKKKTNILLPRCLCIFIIIYITTLMYFCFIFVATSFFLCVPCFSPCCYHCCYLTILRWPEANKNFCIEPTICMVVLDFVSFASCFFFLLNQMDLVLRCVNFVQ